MNKQMYFEDIRAALDGAPPLEVLGGKSVLVTGASGLIGMTLVDMLLLANRERGVGVRVTGLARREAILRERFAGALGDPLFAYLAQDAAEPLRDEYDYIVHAGSPAHPLAFSQDPVGTMRANLLGTLNLLESVRNAGRGRLLYISSGEVYGEGVGDFAEGDMGHLDSMNPRNCYGESKRAAETLCASYVRQYAVDAVVARPCHCYGAAIFAENSRADAQFLRNAARGEDIVMKSAGSQVRSYLYAPDAAAALLWVLVRGKSGEAYNLANPGSVLSIRGYAEMVAERAGVRVRFEVPGDVERAGYSGIARATLCADKLHELGFRARFTVGEGIARMVATTLGALREV